MELTEEEFESHFNLPKITDPEELAKREEALKEAEAMIEEENEEFQEGKKTWFDELNEFSDLPQDEFEKHKTGDLKPEGVDRKFGLGGLEPTVLRELMQNPRDISLIFVNP